MQPETNSQQVLACPMGPNDADAATIRDYLCRLLLDVWSEKECFNGKRPFGNSGWQHELYSALAEQALIDGTKDEWNEWDCDTHWADQLIRDAIRVLADPSTPEDES